MQINEKNLILYLDCDLFHKSRLVFLIRDRPVFKSFTKVDSEVPPNNSLTNRKRDKKKVHTKYQPMQTSNTTRNKDDTKENAAKISSFITATFSNL